MSFLNLLKFTNLSTLFIYLSISSWNDDNNKWEAGKRKTFCLFQRKTFKSTQDLPPGPRFIYNPNIGLLHFCQQFLPFLYQACADEILKGKTKIKYTEITSHADIEASCFK